MNRGERGSVTIVFAAGALLMGTFALAVADLGAMLVARARAQAAAEAAALAAVVRQAPILAQGDDPESAARRAAAANGATLIACDCDVGEAAATVDVVLRPPVAIVPGWRERSVRARARAEVDPDIFTYRDTG